MPLPRVSVVQYLNTVPLIWGMLRGEQRGKYDLSFTTPAACADAVERGEAHLGIIPSIEYQRLERARILPGLSIASKGSVKSVLLLSKLPIEEVRAIAVDDSSRTSTALLQVLLHRFYRRAAGLTPLPPRPAEMLKHADAALVIGDPALTFNGDAPKVYDLGAEWKRFTGLPFVFALWVGREEAHLAPLREDFESSRDYGLGHVDEIAAEYGRKLALAPEAVRLYLTENIDYSLDEENLKGLRLFFKLAHEAGLIAAEKELAFAL